MHGRKIGRAFLGRLASGPNPLGVPGWRVGRAFVGRLDFGPNPLGALGLGRLARGVMGLWPRYPQCPPFPAEEEDHPRSKKKNKVDRHIIGNNLPLMLLNFQRKFCNFFVTALGAIESSVSILRFRSSYKRRVGEEIGYLTGYPRSIVGVG